MAPLGESRILCSSDLDEEKKAQLINELRTLLQGDPVLGNLEDDDELLYRYLLCCRFRVRPAFKKMKRLYDAVIDSPEFFVTKPIEELKPLIKELTTIALPVQDKDGKQVFVMKTGRVDADIMELMDLVQVNAIWCEHVFSTKRGRLEEFGMCVIVDVDGLAWNLTKWGSPYNITTTMKIIENYPVKSYTFHIINSSRLVNFAVKVLWPFFSDQIRSIVHFHHDNYEGLHKHIDPDSIPVEYGGNRKFDYDELCDGIDENAEVIETNFKKRILSCMP